MTTYYAIEPSAAWRQVDDHIFIITPDSRQHELNGTVELHVWGLLDQEPRPLDFLVESVCRTFKVAQSTANLDLGSFLTHLLEAKIINEISK